MAATAFNAQGFRTAFPAFASQGEWPDASLSSWWDSGAIYISTNNADSGLWTQAQAQRANDLMCAHLCAIWEKTSKGQPLAVVTSGSEGSESVGMQAPPIKSAFDHWLSSTPYGLELRMLLELVAAPGFVVGGTPELAAFRGAYGLPLCGDVF